MSDVALSRSLLQELDARQDEVLQQLEELNARIESLLKSCLSERDRDASAEAAR